MSLSHQTTTRRTALVLAIALSLTLAGCGGGGGGGGEDSNVGIGVGPTPASGLNQAGYQIGTTNYVYGLNSIPNLSIEGAPADADFSRWAMLHDGRDYRLYCFQAGSSTTIYQFAYDASRGAYVYGFRSIDVITITGAPADASAASFAMVHDGTRYRLYLRSASDAAVIYQFGFNGRSYEFGYDSIPSLRATGLPADADFSRWAMVHDGTTYRQYVGTRGTTDGMYQLGYDASRSAYVYGFRSISQLNIVGMPANSVTTSFAMLHDGADYRLYHLVR